MMGAEGPAVASARGAQDGGLGAREGDRGREGEGDGEASGLGIVAELGRGIASEID